MFFEYEMKEKTSLEDLIYLKDGYPFSNREELAVAVKHYSRREVLKRVAYLISENNLMFPYRDYSEEKLRSTFTQLKHEKYDMSYEEWKCYKIPKIDHGFKGKQIIFNSKKSYYNKLSNFYMQGERLKTSYRGNISPLNYWEKLRKKECDGKHLTAVFMRPTFNRAELLRCFDMSIHIKSVTQFKPQVAKNIYDFFDAKNVLDFCSGWGDRLVGFLASNAESYIGIDPNSNLHKPYKKIQQLYAPNKKTTFICSPAEEVDYSDLKYDFVFTSPPYFDLEIYTQEETQSIRKFNKLDLWLEGFLFKSLSKVYEGLEEGGRIAVNICDFEGVEICTKIIQHMESTGAVFEGIVGYGIQARSSVLHTDDLPLCEPIFIWSKGAAPEPKWNQDNFFGV